jgi:hypothetical protein
MKKVIVESPFAGNVARNLAYVRACMADCLKRGEAPYASHALHTQPGVLDDTLPAERELGIAAGFAWRSVADLTVFYTDLGWSGGMKAGLQACLDADAPYTYRELRGVWAKWASLDRVAP